MEFGIFLNGYIPGPAAHDTELEHTELMREAEYAIFADKHNWKYAWFGEHHGARRVQRTCRPPRSSWATSPPQTDYIHLSHRHHQPLAAQGAPGPLRRAGRHARPLHRQPLRVRHRSGRRQPRDGHLQHHGHELDQGRVGRGRPGDPADVGAGRLHVHGEHFTVPTPHNILPKPYGKGHPPIWVACGNPPTFERAGELGIGAIAFNFEPIFDLRGRIAAYKEGVANCTDPIGQFKNDNVMITNSVICFEDRDKARQIAFRKGRGYLVIDGQPVPRHHAEVDGRDHLAGHAAQPDGPRRRRRRRPPRQPDRGRLHADRQPRRGVRADLQVGRRRHGPARVRPARSRACTTTRSSRCSSSSATRSSPSSTRTASTRPTTTARRPVPEVRQVLASRSPKDVEWPTVIPESGPQASRR